MLFLLPGFSLPKEGFFSITMNKIVSAKIFVLAVLFGPTAIPQKCWKKSVREGGVPDGGSLAELFSGYQVN